MSELIISVSGLRGVIGESLDPQVASRYVSAFLSTLAPGPIVLATDGRSTGGMLTDVVRSTTLAAGFDCLDAGIAATPTVGVLVKKYHAQGAVQISASHNPPQYNGLKLFAPEGRVLTALAGERVVQAYHSLAANWATYDKIGKVIPCGDTTSDHLALILETIDAAQIRKRKFRVLLDSNHASGSLLGVALLNELGCEVVAVGDTVDGQFAHPPEPTAENLVSVCEKVRSVKVDIGFCQDPDADRLAVLDAAGNYLGEEYTLAMCVDHLLHSRKGPIVTNCATSRMSQDLAEKHGVPFFRSAVGEANVVDRMLAENALLGGEGNGGTIDPRVVLVRDSFVGMAFLLDAMTAREATIKQLADELPRYAICKTKITLAPEKVPEALDRLEKHFSDAQADRLDGLRLDWDRSWLLVRASNTEPIVRAIAEAETSDQAQALCSQAQQLIAQIS